MFDSGNTGFMLVATSLVMLMTPGLAFFYGGLVGRRNVLSIMIQSFVSMGVTTVLWYAVGYSLCFSGDGAAIIGNLDLAFLRGVTAETPFASGQIPLLVFIAYQMMFAIITPALITGAFSNRVRFPAYLCFLVLWLLLVYFPFVHMVWGGGHPAAHGACSTSPAASSCTTSRAWPRSRRSSTWDDGAWRNRAPTASPWSRSGTGLLWFGWYGFNAGSELQVDAITGLAFINTDVAASFAAITWMTIEWSRKRKPQLHRPAHRCGGGSGHHHAGCRLRGALGGADHRHGGRVRLLPRRGAEEQAAAGTTHSTCGEYTAWAAPWA